MSSDSSPSSTDLAEVLKEVVFEASKALHSAAFYMANRTILSKDIDRVMDNAIGKIEVVLRKLTPDERDKAEEELKKGHLKTSVKLTKEDLARVFYSLPHVTTFCDENLKLSIPVERLMALRDLHEKLNEYGSRIISAYSKKQQDEVSTSGLAITFYAGRLIKLIKLMNKVKALK